MRNADVHPVFREATYELAFVGDAAIALFEGFGPKLLSALSSRRGSAKVGTPAKPLEPLDLNLRLPDVERFEKAYATAIEACKAGLPAPILRLPRQRRATSTSSRTRRWAT